MNQIKDPNSDTAKALETALSQTSASNIVVLSVILDKLPPQAAQKVAFNVVRSLEKAVNRIENPKEQEDKDKKEKTKGKKNALAMLEKKYGVQPTTTTTTQPVTGTTATDTGLNTTTNTATNTATQNNTTSTQTSTTSATQAANGVIPSTGTGSKGEQNKSDIAKEREKGQSPVVQPQLSKKHQDDEDDQNEHSSQQKEQKGGENHGKR